MKVHILVLGDIDVSPRIRNHAVAFSKEDVETHLSGYVTSDVPSDLFKQKNLFIHKIPPFPSVLDRNLFVAKLFKFFWLLFVTFFRLAMVTNVDWIFIQTPPAVPMFLAVWVYVNCVGLLSRSRSEPVRVAVDWHNYGFSILHKTQLSRRECSSPANKDNNVQRKDEQSLDRIQNSLTMMAKIHKYLEIEFAKRHFTKKNYLHFCVSRSMRKDLEKKDIRPCRVVYDRPLGLISTSEIENSRQRLLLQLLDFVSSENKCNLLKQFLCDENEIAENDHQWKKRPFLVVSSCSWTVDDDFLPLFTSLDHYAEQMTEDLQNSDEYLPPLVCVITGKGPLKSYWLDRIHEQETKWKGCVQVLTPWISSEDYPLMLSCGDLGVCMHRSTSGLDLPMKVVDMFEAEVPVLAYRYDCLQELIREGENGRMFSDATDLFDLLKDFALNHRKCSTRNNCNCALAEFRIKIRAMKKYENWGAIWPLTVMRAMEN